VTQKSGDDSDSDDGDASQPASLVSTVAPQATPDTLVLTKELTQNLSAQTKKPDEKETQDTVLMSSEELTAERAPGFMEEYPGFLDSSESEGECFGHCVLEISRNLHIGVVLISE
jgi:hypothetical protein